MALTDYQYYRNEGNSPEDLNWGNYQYITLEEVINDFLLVYVGDDKIINKVDRNEVVFYAKRALQELHYDALKETRGIEFEVPSTLKWALPIDFVSETKIGFVGPSGKTHPIMPNRNIKIPTALLQDDSDDKMILFDNDGNALTGTSVTEYNYSTKATQVNPSEASPNDPGARFGLDASTANSNGTYVINKKEGYVFFSSDLTHKDVVIEYISDGMYDLADSEIKVHKLAEEYLYNALQARILKSKFGVQEYIVRRVEKQASASLRNTKIRLNSIKAHELTQVLRGRDKWIK
jgi:hypothetical protein